MTDTTTLQAISSPAFIGTAGRLAALLSGIALDVHILSEKRRRNLTMSTLRDDFQRALPPWTPADGAMTLIAILFVLGAGLIAAEGARRYLAFRSLHNDGLMRVLRMSLWYAAGLGAVWFFMRRRGLSWSEAFHSGDRRVGLRVRQALFAFVAMLPAYQLAMLANSALLYWAGYVPENQDIIDLLERPDCSLWSQAVLGFMAVVAAPVVEELLFRGIALPIALRHIHPTISLLLVSMFFAELHAHLASILPLFIFAISLGLAYMYTHSLLVPILMHVFFNAVAILGVICQRMAG